MTSIYEPLRIYGVEGPTLVCDRAAYLEGCACGRSVLHVGCTDAPMTAERLKAGTLLHQRLEDSAASVLGIDISQEGLDVLRTYGYHVEQGDAEGLRFESQFQVVLAGDVLEHLNNPGLFIEGAVRALVPEGELIIAVPCAFTANTIKTWLRGTEQVHKDHVAYYSPKTLATLCARYDLLPTFLGFTMQPADEGESGLFIRLRSRIIRTFPTMAPAIIMRFRKSAAVERAVSYYWP